MRLLSLRSTLLNTAAFFAVTTLGFAQSAPATTAAKYTVDQLIALTGQLQNALKSGDTEAASSLANRISVGIHESFPRAPKSNQDEIRNLETMLSRMSIPEMAAPLRSTLAVNYLRAGDANRARLLADQAVREMTRTPGPGKASFPLDSDGLHQARLVLGAVALQDGDVLTAKRNLLDAGRFTESETKKMLGIRGPDFELAKGLLKCGEKDAVLEYLSLVRKWWSAGTDRLDEWSATIRGGGTPSFPASARGF